MLISLIEKQVTSFPGNMSRKGSVFMCCIPVTSVENLYHIQEVTTVSIKFT